ncbi:hypothetical protein AMTR_s00024p00140530 [Amborella trichopoda]|uniref:Uncharacterized protein n=1 Tax=Amborella trichopoda TaxID=13333 RepID=W1PUW4_AMBTC|nr:hypothetical protein AMTR_s00024p00140530 [Amborella trichopoda]
MGWGLTSCVDAVLLQVGINPAVAVAIPIPKRCGLKKRPVGYKCGRKNTTL